MESQLAEVRCRTGGNFEVRGTTSIRTTYFRASDAPVEVPRWGSHPQGVTCAYCGAPLKILVRSGRSDTVRYTLILLVVLGALLTAGWLLAIKAFSLYAAAWSLMWVVGAFPAGLLALMLVRGAGPSAHMAARGEGFSGGGQHDVKMKSAHDRWHWPVLGGGLLLWLLLGYGFHKFEYGTPVDSDELVALIGKERDDPAVRWALIRLGHGRIEDGASIRWRRHNLKIHFSGDRVQRIDFSDMGSPYTGGFPYGLSGADGPADVERKLGPNSKGLWTIKDNSVRIMFHYAHVREVTVEMKSPPES